MIARHSHPSVLNVSFLGTYCHGKFMLILKSRCNAAKGSACPWHCETCINYAKKHYRPQSNFFLTAPENRTQRISGLWAAIKPEALVTRILHFDVAHNSSVTKKKLTKNRNIFKLSWVSQYHSRTSQGKTKTMLMQLSVFLSGGLGRGVLGMTKVYWQCENSDDIKPVQHKIPAGLRTGLLRR